MTAFAIDWDDAPTLGYLTDGLDLFEVVGKTASTNYGLGGGDSIDRRVIVDNSRTLERWTVPERALSLYRLVVPSKGTA